jgi:hypothetical protein
VDGAPVNDCSNNAHTHGGETDSVTLYARDYIASGHTLTVKVIKAGVLYTRELKFTVTE